MVKLLAQIIDGTLKIINPSIAKGKLSQYEGKLVNLNISKHTSKRSDKQNAWYYGVAIPCVINHIKETTGETYSKEDIHDWHLSKVVRPKIETKEMFNQTIVIYKTKRTSDMTTVEFTDFKEAIQMYWAERECIVPDPNQEEFINKEN